MTGVGFDKVCRLNLPAISGSLSCVRCSAELPPSNDVSECICVVIRAYDWEGEWTRIYWSNVGLTDRVGAIVGLTRVSTRTSSKFLCLLLGNRYIAISTDLGSTAL